MPRAKSTKYRGKESELQASCIKWLKLQCPELVCVHVPNGGMMNKAFRMKLGRMGCISGFPDVMIFKATSLPLFVELKVYGGSLSDNQKKVHEKLRGLGYTVDVAWNLEEFIESVSNYIS